MDVVMVVLVVVAVDVMNVAMVVLVVVAATEAVVVVVVTVAVVVVMMTYARERGNCVFMTRQPRWHVRVRVYSKYQRDKMCNVAVTSV
jgi:hypothetical protein